MRGIARGALCCGLTVALGMSAVRAETDATSAPAGTGAPQWSWGVTGYWYMPPEGGNYLDPVVTVDRDRLHLEARYNYEDRDTGSIFGGWRFSTGRTVEFEAIPMLGAVFGRTDGIAPACTFTLSWKQLSLDSENEYVYVPSDRFDSFFYSWTELAWDPLEWLGGGIVAQRTRVYHADRDLQRGLFARVGAGRFAGTVYWLNPGEDDAFAVVAFGVEY